MYSFLTWHVSHLTFGGHLIMPNNYSATIMPGPHTVHPLLTIPLSELCRTIYIPQGGSAWLGKGM